MDQEISNKINELQNLEQSLQSFLMQKQTIQMELNEILNAQEELKKSDNEVYKIISGMMIKSNKLDLDKELNEKKKIFELRISSIDKQERIFEEKISKIQAEINSSISKDDKN